MFEKTRWMLSRCYREDASLYFRKEFDVPEKIKSATLYISVLGQGICSINGKNVADDVLSTPYTRYDKRILYREYDVTDLIKVGKNAIGIHAGNGFFNNNMRTWSEEMATWRDKPRALVNLFITMQNGDEILIKSDNSWKSDFGCCPYNGVRRGEICDARLRVPYDEVGFDDSEWKYVEAVAEPGGIYEPFDMEPIRVIRELVPISRKNGVYDFGENTSGWCKIRVSGERGREIRIKYGEALDDDGNICDHSGDFSREEGFELVNEDVFICSGGKDEEYAPTFLYHGFRYAQVSNAPSDFKIVAQVVHTDLKKIGEFRCSDELLNKIHMASVRSTLTNYHGIPEDCPHREQNGWLGDAHLSSDQAMMNFDMVKAYKKYVKDITDTQRPNGALSGIAPTSNWGYNCGVSWTAAFLIIPWNVYVHTGDKQMLEENWDRFVKFSDYCERMSDNYIFELGYNDWCPPNGIKVCSAEILNTAYLHKVFELMAKIGQLLEKEYECYIQKADMIKCAWLERFWHTDEWKDNQTFLACALYHNFIDDEKERKETAERLAKLIEQSNYHLEMGIFGIKYVFTVLSEYGYGDVLYRAVTNPTCPSYAYWINSGMTTLCESWGMGSSLNHHMFSEIDNWFYKCLAGIKISKDGITVKPIKVSGINQVKANHRGISVDIENDVLKLEIPDCFDKVTVNYNGKEEVVGSGRYIFK